VDGADDFEWSDAREELEEADSPPVLPVDDELQAPLAPATRTIIDNTFLRPGACGTFGTFWDFAEATDAESFIVRAPFPVRPGGGAKLFARRREL
jgi:hypothetical protein